MFYNTDFSIINELVDNFKKDFNDSVCNNIKVYIFPQMWGSTALGYGGLGGCAMTTAHTIVIYDELLDIVRVYFGSERLTYEVKEPNNKFFEDLRKHQLVSKSQFEKYVRENKV